MSLSHCFGLCAHNHLTISTNVSSNDAREMLWKKEENMFGDAAK